VGRSGSSELDIGPADPTFVGFACVSETVLSAMVPSPDNLRFERYLRDSFAALVGRLRASFSERVAAEDLVQEALLRAWQLDARGEPIRSLEPWMTAAATNLARSKWRTIKAEDRALERLATDRSGDPVDVLRPSASGRSGDLVGAMGELSPRQGQVVVLHYYGDLSVREIARRLGVSEGTVKGTLHDARAELRRLIGRNQTATPQRRQSMTGWDMAGSHPSQYEHEIAADTTYQGKLVVHMWCSAERADGFGTLMQMFSPSEFTEQRVRFSGALRCEQLDGRVALWMRVDGAGGAMLAFDNMADRPIRGTMDWEHYEVVLDVPAEAQAIAAPSSRRGLDVGLQRGNGGHRRRDHGGTALAPRISAEP